MTTEHEDITQKKKDWKVASKQIAEYMLAFAIKPITLRNTSGVEIYKCKDEDGIEQLVIRVRTECDYKELDVNKTHVETDIVDVVREVFQFDEERVMRDRKEYEDRHKVGEAI